MFRRAGQKEIKKEERKVRKENIHYLLGTDELEDQAKAEMTLFLENYELTVWMPVENDTVENDTQELVSVFRTFSFRKLPYRSHNSASTLLVYGSNGARISRIDAYESKGGKLEMADTVLAVITIGDTVYSLNYVDFSSFYKETDKKGILYRLDGFLDRFR